MTFYEIVITVHGDGGTVVVSLPGLGDMARTLEVFGDMARSGRIPGVTRVDLYEAFDVSGPVLIEALDELSLSTRDIDPVAKYSITLFET